VPLSDAALVVLRKQNAVRRGSFVFPGQRARKPEATPDLTKRAEGRPLSSMALLMVLRRMKRGDLTAHGFRSTFRDWVAEQTNFPHEVAEMALAHAVGDKVEAAYRRGDLFEKRRELADAWGQYCTRVPTGMRAEGAVEATSTDVVLPWSGKQAAGSRPATAA